jgi:DNA-binding PadR family transcriptional regulator
MLRHSLLGLLRKAPAHGYDLKAAFEGLLGGTWPVNAGQVYSTLARLERDGLVECSRVAQELVPDKKVYELTSSGELELKRWLGEPVTGPVRVRDELLVKVLVQVVVDPSAARGLLHAQREVQLRHLGELTASIEDAEPTTRLVLEGAALHVEADLEWLDRCEERLEELGG